MMCFSRDLTFKECPNDILFSIVASFFKSYICGFMLRGNEVNGQNSTRFTCVIRFNGQFDFLTSFSDYQLYSRLIKE